MFSTDMGSKQMEAAGPRPENGLFGFGRFYNVARCLSRPTGP
ncbi:hypothetical protein BF49_0096 [Bradyrhizobium sp.]|nr:hypothetical protein BF49_0096 [Bradyrhizobium sp.]